ncbi:hypothetical protein COEREDRAFT_80630 [Coemansia reversa NRRL 1564]|uniref:Uncharacterized protein n=1 Tax=Coemansia reversa (strain ATCC 12441 / NRRL 1564) TaxID=763665 RepID=A0A2G5BE65_COERN|nr:hypothetical protein COEREDRAFT_80630 [Coemansia reversa NRRL 1564]|eukprot:PIA17291.1 hypothetical protein COEREDRAFT_80630 [Coemansia reversa NRRL 1564]
MFVYPIQSFWIHPVIFFLGRMTDNSLTFHKNLYFSAAVVLDVWRSNDEVQKIDIVSVFMRDK